jgi:hypothetical protein
MISFLGVPQMQSAAYRQTREAIAKIAASIALLEEHFDKFHASCERNELHCARVKVQDLFAQVEALQLRLNRCAEPTPS